MKKQLPSVALFTLFLVVSISPVASVQDKTAPDGYSGVAMGTGGSVGGRTISFDFRVTQHPWSLDSSCMRTVTLWQLVKLTGHKVGGDF
jgi:hypothetical protein